MQEPYDVEIVDQEEYYAPAQKKGMSGWLIALIVVLALVVLCCLCACVVLLLIVPAGSYTFPSILETLEIVTPVP